MSIHFKLFWVSEEKSNLSTGNAVTVNKDAICNYFNLNSSNLHQLRSTAVADFFPSLQLY